MLHLCIYNKWNFGKLKTCNVSKEKKKNLSIHSGPSKSFNITQKNIYITSFKTMIYKNILKLQK